jgi:hypothetical protein
MMSMNRRFSSTRANRQKEDAVDFLPRVIFGEIQTPKKNGRSDEEGKQGRQARKAKKVK